MPSSEHRNQSLSQIVFSRLSLGSAALLGCLRLCRGRFPLGIFPLAHDSLWGPNSHPYRAASPLLRQGFDGLQSGTDIPFRAWCSCVTQSGGNPSRVTLLSPLLGKSSWFSQDREWSFIPSGLMGGLSSAASGFMPEVHLERLTSQVSTHILPASAVTGVDSSMWT